MSLEENIRGLGDAPIEEVISAPLLSDWRVRRFDGKETRLTEQDLIDYLWYWRRWYPPTPEKRTRAAFKPGFEEEMKSIVKGGFTLRNVEHFARMGYENRAFLYEFDARVTGQFRFQVPFVLLKPELRTYMATLEAKHRQGGWTQPENVFEIPIVGRHGNKIPRKQPHPWHLIEAKDRSIFLLNRTLTNTERSFWSKLRRGTYEPYAKVIYSELTVT